MRSKFGKYGLVAGLLLAVGVMTTAVSYSVTLYRLFCSATGSLGTTQRVASDTAAVSAHTVTVYFNTDVSSGLPWQFKPMQRKVVVHLGAQTPVFFEATNTSDQDMVGHATFNVTPGKAGIYFKKIECFCFTEERLGAHKTVQMPVEFYVDPKIATDPSTSDVHEITLSYTFFRSAVHKPPTDLARFVDGPPNPEIGGKLFAASCGECHEADRAKIGPPLAGVIGRRAGSVPGYPYTPALAHAAITWNAQTLDTWLTNPQADVPGTAMPMKVANPLARRDIIAYLRTLSAAPPAGKGGS